MMHNCDYSHQELVEYFFLVCCPKSLSQKSLAFLLCTFSNISFFFRFAFMVGWGMLIPLSLIYLGSQVDC